jgi:hypothetical protein
MIEATAASRAERFGMDDFPRIDRYFPQCKLAAFEASARFLYGIESFAKIYGRHSFEYQRPPGATLGLRDNGVELDLFFHRVAPEDDELESLVEDIYGIQSTILVFRELELYRRYVLENLRARVPVPTDFDLKFIRERREYGRVSQPHVIVWHAHDPETGGFFAAEQMLGTIRVDRGDLEECFAQKLKSPGGEAVWELTRVRNGQRELERDEVLARCAANISNLTAADESLGLRALARFGNDMSQKVQSETFDGRPFAIPGLWVFSHERHIERKWLAAIEHLCPNSGRSFLVEFDELLSTLFKHWLAVDYVLEKCLASQNGKALRALPKSLNELVRDEQRALEHWIRLEELVRGAR